jgi:hypothetical protein
VAGDRSERKIELRPAQDPFLSNRVGDGLHDIVSFCYGTRA